MTDLDKRICVGYDVLCTLLMQAASAYATANEPQYSEARDGIEADASAIVRAVTIMCIRYQDTGYRDLFYEIQDQLKGDVPAGRIAFDLLDKYGK